MNKKGPIIIIEDDRDDQQILDHIFKKMDLSNEILYFSEGAKAVDYLNATDKKPFIILSDINMPKVNGFELRDQLHSNAALHIKCIPFLFFSTGATPKITLEVYSKSVQGFFKKPASYTDLEETIRVIVQYWQRCETPVVQTHELATRLN